MVQRFGGVLLATLCFFSCTPTPSDDFLRAELPPQPPLASGTTFERIPAAQSGITFVPELQESFQYNFLLDPYEYNGGGVAVLDIDNDGLQDLFFTHRFNGCRLYRNKGNFQFEDISDRSGVSQPSGLKTGVAVVDINTDGYPDLYVCRTWLSNVPERRNLLFVNNHDGTFSEQAATYGIDDPSPSQCANFFDYDLDGDLDLYVVNHPVDFRTMNNAEYQPTAAAPLARSQGPKDAFESDKLFRNDGNGHFEDVSQKAGIHNRAYGLSATTADFNADGYPDIFVANDFVMPDFLYLNNGNGTFREEAHKWFSHSATHSMGCDIGDLNNDGYPELCVPDMLGSTLQRRKELLNTSFLERSKLLERQGYGRQQMRNVLQVYNPSPSPSPGGEGSLGVAGATPLTVGGGAGAGVFSETGCLAGMEATEWSWAPLLADFDHDGWKDLFISAGVFRDLNDQDFFFYTADSLQKTGGVTAGRFKNFEEVAGKLSRYPVHNFMFQNTGSLQLSEVSEAWGLGEKGFSNGAAYADLDNDGDLDLIVNKFNEPAALFANQAAQKSANHWLQIRCKGSPGNPTGTGAKIRVYAGGQLFYQEMTPIRGFYSSVEPVFQVGLGQATQADRLEIEWPEGKFQILERVPANQRLSLNIAQAQSGRLPRPAPPKPWMQPAAQLPAFVHQENDFEDFNRERLLLHRFSRSGPCLAVADVNGDGRLDVFAGGAAGQAGALFLQQADGAFSRRPQAAFDADAQAEDTGAVFLDADGDGDPDLYVVSGGNEADPGADLYQDRLYLNDGLGAFQRSTDGLPRETASGQAVCAFDYDGDQDLDLFVGGRVSPGRFPVIPRSLLLTNDGKGHFAHTPAAALDTAGMVTGAQVADLNGDGRSELILCGEWMPLRVFAFEGREWSDRSGQYGLENTHGFWNYLLARDLDGDGDLDLVAGNEGLNTRLKASPGAPLRLFALDFDLNQSLDPVVAIADAGRYYPLAQRNELATQMPNLIKSKFIRYRSYARAPLEEVLDLKKLRAAQQLRVERLESTWFENRDGRLVAHALPVEAQISCTKTIVVQDFTKDGKPDLLLLGNDSNNTPETGPYDASRGVLLENKGAGGWAVVPNRVHGCWAGGEIRSSAVLPLADGRQLILAGTNNGALQGWIF
ncbi:MAG: VCBS repeat-containing protein [Saprospiraceae bacterium]|nr:VCBS repeat-containing protein [Saprospiraceae bacterium]